MMQEFQSDQPALSWQKSWTTVTSISAKDTSEQIDLLMDRIPGLNREQTEYLLESAFKRDSSVVFGGSRVRGDFDDSSDLDVGFGSLTTAQARKVLDKASTFPDGLTLESTLIVPGNKTRNISEIASPEEFFLRSGIRMPPDARAGQPITPSGYITVTKDGKIDILSLHGSP